MGERILFHGGNYIVKKPEIRKAKYHQDFGDGFYCTFIREQAERRSKKRNAKKSYINIYRLREPDETVRILEFSHASNEWLDFVAKCRNGEEHPYDVVIGPMADDQIWDYVQDYLNGRISRKAFWDLMKFRYPTQQICFCTEKSLDCIKWVKAEAV